MVASSLLLDEHFAAGDVRFLDEVLASDSGKKLKGLAERWYEDRRPFAREALLRYVDDGCDRPHHRALVKRLFKLAEKAGDDELMGRFLVAFDRFLARKIQTITAWSHSRRSYEKTLVVEPDPTVKLTSRGEGDPKFSRRTRRYLQRRAFRYFRRIGAKDPARYGRAIRSALALYEDAHTDSPQKLLDAWGLLHALYGRSKVIARVPRGIVVAPGRSLSELSAAPIHPAAWRDCLGDLVTLVKKAQSRTVRAFALELLRTEYAESLHQIPVLRLRALLLCPHEEAQLFAAELLRSARDIHLLPMIDWLELLTIESPAPLSIVCDLVAKHVSPSRIGLADCVALGVLRPAPVAELGLKWAREKKIVTEEDLATIVGFAKAESPGVRREAAGWIASVLERSLLTLPAHVRDLLDSKYGEVRGEGLELMKRDPRFRDAPLLWAALAESPYDDVRVFFVRHLERRAGALPEGSIRHVWATVLLGIHRGSRAKRKALSQVAAAVARSPEKADDLLPLLQVALRSVRPAERRSALASVALAAARTPALLDSLARKLPEIRVESTEVVR